MTILVEQIGWTSQSGETGNVSLLRGDIATLLGSIGDPTALTYAKANLAVMLNLLPKRTGRKGPTKKIVDKKDRKRSKPLSANVDANMRSMILNTSAQNASSVADLITLYNHTINIEVKEDICRALGHVKIDKGLWWHSTNLFLIFIFFVLMKFYFILKTGLTQWFVD